jgi:hypothetical protein
MNLTRTIKDLENVYSEKVSFPPKGTFELAKGAKEKKKAFISKPSGPAEANGVKEISDPKDLKGKETFQGTEKLSDQNFNENNEKIEQKNINNFMSKSIFDKLFEDVMGVDGADTEAKDALDLGVAAGAAHEADHAEGGDVTFTLPRDLAQKLCDVLHEVLETGAEETAEHEGEAESESEDAEAPAANEAEETVAGEAVDAEVIGHAIVDSEKVSKGLIAKKDNVVGDTTKSLVSKGGGDGKVTDKVGNDGDKGHALVGAGVKGGTPTAPKGKANVVAGKASNVGQYLFQK